MEGWLGFPKSDEIVTGVMRA